MPTLLRVGTTLGIPEAEQLALDFADYLVDIQHPDGGWYPGTWPAQSSEKLNSFSTAQIVKGLCALYNFRNDELWLEAAARAGAWIVKHLEDGPAYQTQIAWPLLELWKLTGDGALRVAAIAILDQALSRRTILGAFEGWGFGGSDAAFTHTIGFTLRGFLESARILDAWPRYGKPMMMALRRLSDDAVSSAGRLPGAYDTAWKSEHQYSCLTGNAQVAICLLVAQQHVDDRRFPRAARLLVDEICRHQSCDHPIPGLRGAIPGSSPPWGRYLRGRYPIWAAKYLCDAIVGLVAGNYASAFSPAPVRSASPAIAFTTM
jgi:hypothetical protein